MPTLGGIRIPQSAQSHHFQIIGGADHGRPAAICELVHSVLAQGHRVMIFGPESDYLRQFYEPARRDVLLNPFLEQSAAWDLFGELDEPRQLSIDLIATHLIPELAFAIPGLHVQVARSVLAACIEGLYRAGSRDMQQLWHHLAVVPNAELAKFLHETGQLALSPSVLHCARQAMLEAPAIDVLKEICTQRGTPLSIRDWVSDGRGALFVPYSTNQLDRLHTLIAAWLGLAIRAATAAGQRARDLWFIVAELDELRTIGGFPSDGSFASALQGQTRRGGGRCVLAYEDYSRLTSRYGPSFANAIIECCSNRLILQCHGSTARLASTLIGERRVARKLRSTTTRWGRLPEQTITEELVTEPAVMPEELGQLPDLEGYLKLDGNQECTRIRLSPP